MKADLLQWHVAAKEAIATLHAVQAQVATALKLLEALPINHAAVNEYPKPKYRFNHAYDFGFEIESNHEEGEDITPAMLRAALIKRASDIDDAEIMEACGLFEPTKSRKTNWKIPMLRANISPIYVIRNTKTGLYWRAGVCDATKPFATWFEPSEREHVRLDANERWEKFE